MVGALALLLGLGLGSSPAEAGAVEIAEVRQCRDWIRSHSERPPNRSARTKILSPRTICFDGEIYSWTLKDAIAWAGKAGADRTQPARLVVRSVGGDAGAAIDLAEKLQRIDAEVTVVDYCMSSCANYFFAGLRRRNVVTGAMILFHGGLSAEERPEVVRAVDEATRDPQVARTLGDPGEWRAAQLKAYDENLARQDALYRRVGVDPLVVTGMASVDQQAIPASACGGRKEAPRSTLFFDMKQLRRLGILIKRGKPSTNPLDTDRRLSQFGFSFTACAAPADYFTTTSQKGRSSR